MSHVGRYVNAIVRNLDPHIIQRRVGLIKIIPHVAMYFAVLAMNFTTRFTPDVARRRDAVCDTLAFPVLRSSH